MPQGIVNEVFNEALTHLLQPFVLSIFERVLFFSTVVEIDSFIVFIVFLSSVYLPVVFLIIRNQALDNKIPSFLIFLKTLK